MTTPSASDPLATYQAFNTITGVAGADQARVEKMLAQASKRVRRHCHWHIYPELADDVLTVDGSGTALIELPTLFVTEVASVVEDGVTLVEGTDYEWADFGILTRLNGEWTTKRRAVVVTLTHGYEDVPEDVEGVVCEIVAAALESSFASSQESGGGTQAIYLINGVTLSAAQRNALGPYQIRT